MHRFQHIHFQPAMSDYHNFCFQLLTKNPPKKKHSFKYFEVIAALLLAFPVSLLWCYIFDITMLQRHKKTASILIKLSFFEILQRAFLFFAVHHKRIWMNGSYRLLSLQRPFMDRHSAVTYGAVDQALCDGGALSAPRLLFKWRLR